MPLYQYACARHGGFECFATMANCSDQQKCPTCGDHSPRQFVAVQVVSDTSLFTAEHLGKIAGAGDDTMVGEHYRKVAEAAGVVTRGKQYISQLAEYPADPRAWVDNRGDMIRLAKAQNKSIDGLGIKLKHEQVEPSQGGLAEDLAKKLAKDIMKKNPGMKPEKALAEAVDRHAPPGQKRIIKAKKAPPRFKPKLKPVRR